MICRRTNTTSRVVLIFHPNIGVFPIELRVFGVIVPTPVIDTHRSSAPRCVFTTEIIEA